MFMKQAPGLRRKKNQNQRHAFIFSFDKLGFGIECISFVKLQISCLFHEHILDLFSNYDLSDDLSKKGIE